MPISTAPALLIGLGARILLNAIYRGPDVEASIGDSILLGVWQGVGLQYAGKQPPIAVAVGTAITLKLFYDFALAPDLNRSLTTIIGVALGVIGTELLSSYVDQLFVVEPVEPRKRKPSTASNGHRIAVHVRSEQPKHPRAERIVQFRPSVQGGSVETVVNLGTPTLVSDITSVESTFELLGHKPSATPMEREISALRARASLADSERRRYREERKWALAQGNLARADQMKSEYKRYKALMESCHREADLKLLAMEASRERASRRDTRDTSNFPREFPPQNHSPTAGPSANGHSNHSSPSHQRRISSTKHPRDPNR